jgi:hypothetical protein
MARILKKVLLGTLGIAALAVGLFLILPPPTVSSNLPDGISVRVEPRSLVRSIAGGQCRITLQTAGGKAQEFALWQDLFHRPVLIAPIEATNIVLCLYEFDTDLRLLRVNVSRAFMPVHNINTNIVSTIVCSSSCDIQNATIRDWQRINDYLSNSAPATLGPQIVSPFPLGFDRQRRLQFTAGRVKAQTMLMLENGATEWPMSGR